MKSLVNIIVVFALTSNLFSQINNDEIVLSGNLNIDSKILMREYSEPLLPKFSLKDEDEKSPVLAGLFSLLVPGAGEIYSEEYVKAGIFLAIEAAVITTAVIYDGKGDDKTIVFQNYADDYKNPAHNWSVLKYAQWLIQFEDGDPNMILSNDPNRPPWEQVDWALLNASEKGSHKLPRHGEQQYYELIGKYHQYSSGWNDYTGGPNKNEISPNFIYYSGMRGEANDFYSVASTAVIGIYVNHFLSALDAVWSATQFNKDLAIKLRIENIQYASYAQFYPKLYLTYNF